MEAGRDSTKDKEEPEKVYQGLNPGELKRNIAGEQDRLYHIYGNNRETQRADPRGKLTPSTVTPATTVPTWVTYLNSLTWMSHDTDRLAHLSFARL